MAKQRFLAYVGFVDGVIDNEDVIDQYGDFYGVTVYTDKDAALQRYEDVREVELVIGKRVKKSKS